MDYTKDKIIEMTGKGWYTILNERVHKSISDHAEGGVYAEGD